MSRINRAGFVPFTPDQLDPRISRKTLQDMQGEMDEDGIIWLPKKFYGVFKNILDKQNIQAEKTTIENIRNAAKVISEANQGIEDPEQRDLFKSFTCKLLEKLFPGNQTSQQKTSLSSKVTKYALPILGLAMFGYFSKPYWSEINSLSATTGTLTDVFNSAVYGEDKIQKHINQLLTNLLISAAKSAAITGGGRFICQKLGLI